MWEGMERMMRDLLDADGGVENCNAGDRGRGRTDHAKRNQTCGSFANHPT